MSPLVGIPPRAKIGSFIKGDEKNFLLKSLGSLLGAARAFQVTRIKVECCLDERFVKVRRVNPTKFFDRAEAAERLQSCRRLRDRWMARDADRGNRSSGFASLRCDYERGSLACDLRIPIALISAWHLSSHRRV
jgi:hypothetical protein